MDTPPLLYLRADASASMGTGHVMRLLALAQAWIARGGVAALAAHNLPERLSARVAQFARLHAVAARAGSPEDAAEAVALMGSLGARACVIDGYQFDATYVAALSASSPASLLIDDFARLNHYPCALVLNQNLHADPRGYAGKASPDQLLLGPQFALLRQEFVRARTQVGRPAQRARRVLVTFGGADPKGGSLLSLDAQPPLAEAGLDMVLIVGAANPAASAILAMGEGRPRLALLSGVSDMAAQMRAADLLVCAGGTTLWEGCALGMPMLTLATHADEDSTARRLASAGAVRHLGMIERMDPDDLARAVLDLAGNVEERAAMRAAGMALVDGDGAARVVQALWVAAGLA